MITFSIHMFSLALGDLEAHLACSENVSCSTVWSSLTGTERNRAIRDGRSCIALSRRPPVLVSFNVSQMYMI